MKYLKLKTNQLLKLTKITIALLLMLIFLSASADKRFIILQATTSTQDSGLYDYLLPVFENKFNIDVRVVAVGTGQALKNIQNCDGDIAITHAKELELDYLSKKYINSREEFMYNDFIFIGPNQDPAMISSALDPKDVLSRIYKTKSKFVSRGDGSGTHISEQRLWNSSGLSPDEFKSSWYLDVGMGMGATINVAVGINGYTFTDRATWVNFKNKGSHKMLYSNHQILSNQYSVLTPNHDVCGNIKTEMADIFRKWLLSIETKRLIEGYKVNQQQLFYIN